MPWFAENKERERFYLFAGMGGKAARRKHKTILLWSLVAGLLVSACLAAAILILNQLGH